VEEGAERPEGVEGRVKKEGSVMCWLVAAGRTREEWLPEPDVRLFFGR
jgi:hypothetical protein